MLRADQKIIADLIASDSKVIDIGCGNGELLTFLANEKNVAGHGLEIESERVSAAVENGLSVVQGNADKDLQYYPSGGFDYAILGLTLQVMQKPRAVLEEALRVAEKAIVSIPNFGHFRNQVYLMRKGRMPVTKTLTYQWYETPNIHFCTIKDFEALAGEINCNIERSFFLTKSGKAKPFSDKNSSYANLLGEQGIFVLGK